MATLVASERHLWLNLTGMQERDRVVLLDSPVSPTGLFGGAVEEVLDRFQETTRQAAAFRRYLPRRFQSPRLGSSSGLGALYIGRPRSGASPHAPP